MSESGESNQGGETLVEPCEAEITSFDQFGLKEDLLRGIYAYGFEKPSILQQRTILPLTSGRDVIVQAQPKSGRTTTISISILQIIDTSLRDTQALVIAPVRDLATRAQSVITALGEYMNVQCHACTGGTPIKDDIRKLNDGVHIVSGTPGRILDMIKRGKLLTPNIKILVIEEADELLAEGFKDQIHEIYGYLSPTIQVVFLSENLPHALQEMTTKFMSNPIRIIIEPEKSTLESIKQFFVAVEREDWKFDSLCNLYKTLGIPRAVIFCNFRRHLEPLVKKLREANITASTLNGKMAPNARDASTAEFRNGSTSVLVTTGNPIRGLDIGQVSVVFNFNMPAIYEDYPRRLRSLGESKSKGIVINLVTIRDLRRLRDIKRLYNIKVGRLPPNAAELIRETATRSASPSSSFS